MTYQTITFEVTDRIATVTLNRPEKLNAYTPAMGDEIVDAFRRVGADDDVRVVILTGAGKAFCAGVDLDYVTAVAAGEIDPSSPRLGEEDFVRKWPLDVLSDCKPVIAALNGAAVGVGVTMILPCDVRIAADDAKLRLNFTRLGMLPGLGSTHLLPQIVGAGHALDLILGARTLSAPAAVAMGLVQEVAPAAELLQVARARAAAIAECDPRVTAAAKALLRQGAREACERAMQRERAASATLRR
jgi:enoyl-CoA hydratase/carnithine racemase